MKNPWCDIKLSSYERHMQSGQVFQLQTLGQITQEQLAYPAAVIAILGIAGGNGLEYIDLAKTKKIVAYDINQIYLDECKARFSYLGDRLATICCDLGENDFMLQNCDLLICNLIIEYLGIDVFCNLLKRNLTRLKTVTCVIQKDHGNNFVSSSEASSELASLNAIHNDIDEHVLDRSLKDIGFHLITRKSYLLPNHKEFIRLDYHIV